MKNNDVLRSLRYILNISEQKMTEVIALSGLQIPLPELSDMLKDEEDPNYLDCDDELLAHFLDGLIYFKRGRDDSKPALPLEIPVSNNLVLKKLRVAYQLKEEDMHELLRKADYPLGRSELSALLRKKDHPNYRECGDQVLRYFLKGLKTDQRGS